MKRRESLLNMVLLFLLIFFFILLVCVPIAMLAKETSFEQIAILFSTDKFNDSLDNSFVLALLVACIGIPFSFFLSWLLATLGTTKTKRGIIEMNANALKNLLFLFTSFAFSTLLVTDRGILSDLFKFDSIWPLAITVLWTVTPYMVLKFTTVLINVQIRYIKIYKTTKISNWIKLKIIFKEIKWLLALSFLTTFLMGFMTNSIALYGDYDLADIHGNLTLHTLQQIFAKKGNSRQASTIAIGEIFILLVFTLLIVFVQYFFHKQNKQKAAESLSIKWENRRFGNITLLVIGTIYWLPYILSILSSFSEGPFGTSLFKLSTSNYTDYWNSSILNGMLNTIFYSSIQAVIKFILYTTIVYQIVYRKSKILKWPSIIIMVASMVINRSSLSYGMYMGFDNLHMTDSIVIFMFYQTIEPSQFLIIYAIAELKHKEYEKSLSITPFGWWFGYWKVFLKNNKIIKASFFMWFIGSVDSFYLPTLIGLSTNYDTFSSGLMSVRDINGAPYLYGRLAISIVYSLLILGLIIATSQLLKLFKHKEKLWKNLKRMF